MNSAHSVLNFKFIKNILQLFTMAYNFGVLRFSSRIIGNFWPFLAL